ncbi:biotin--[acetyl-CoA-carboxylase] ligase [Thalassobacillus pellis]|uniref:biotin--[acetyl-CoA-carboxylase] ligase n=1 Tax=Thalassobacillus pellis TaxID=748008 RepID=UPI001961C48F|nr:biotin--[acetyl-CoA-carboxylase] ligase [Thalassobacillus pellis]MBM7552488.1 BirA family biotin operon repressor/biotin-[acetyl-CoA-carboxylase] ligase [Thalassobacillus pellis]
MESTRQKMIKLLANNRTGYISGQELSRQLSVSRTAIWKHMKELEKDGYIIEAAPKKGYRIIDFPDKVSQNTLRWGLNTTWAGQELFHYNQVASTQEIAHKLAAEGHPHGTLVVADEQVKGKGRMARPWHSQKKDGIWMSLLLRPDLPPVQAPQITLLAATVLAKAIASASQVEPQIKWPNDLLINHKKMAGILTEMQAEQDQIQYVVLGMGININQDPGKFPDEIKKKATSLRQETGETWNITWLIQLILETFENTYEQFVHEGFGTVKKTWEQYGYKIGEQVTISTMRKTWEATLLGIEADGALLVKGIDGREEKLYSAEIHWGEGGYNADA